MITTIGIDLAKTVLHAVVMDAGGKVVQRRRLDRTKLLQWLANQGPCLVGMEACAGAHHLARALAAQGHDVRLMPGQYVKPFVKTHQNDLTDAEAICEAVQRPQMRFVPIKTPAQLDVQALHRARDRLVGMRTALVNQIRGFLLERGVAVARGRRSLEKALPGLLEAHADELGAMLRQLIESLRAQWRAVDQPIAALDEQILALARQDDTSQRLMAIIASGNDPVPQGIDRLPRRSIGRASGRCWPPLSWRRSAAAPRGSARRAAWRPLRRCSGQRRSLRDRIDAAGIDGSASCRTSTAAAARPGSSGWPGTATAICAGCPLPNPASGACGTLAQAGGARPRRPARPLAAGAGGQGARQRGHRCPGSQARPLRPAGIWRCPPLRGWIDRRRRSMGDDGPPPSLSRGRLSPPARHHAQPFCSAREDMATTVARRRNSLSNESALGRPAQLPGPRRADPIAARGMLTASSQQAGYIHADATWPELNKPCRTGADHTFVRASPPCREVDPIRGTTAAASLIGNARLRLVPHARRSDGRCCGRGGDVGDAPASSKRSVMSTALPGRAPVTPARQTAIGVRLPSA